MGKVSQRTPNEGGTQDQSSSTSDPGIGFHFLLVTALLLFAIAYMVGYGLHAGEVNSYIKDVLFAVGTAFLVTWGLTRIFEVPHVTNYAAGKLADLMFGEQYLASIKPSLPDVRRRIDRVLYGEAALGYSWSLYNFVNSQVHEFYTSSFRRNLTVEITCKRSGDNPGFMSWREKTSYLYVRNKDDRRPPVIELFHTSSLEGGQALTGGSEVDLKASFNSRIINLELRVGETVYKAAPGDRTKLVASDGTQGEIGMNWGVESAHIAYDCKYRIPTEMLEAGKEVRVEIIEEYLDPCKDDMYYVGVLEPTEDFSLVCDFPEDVRLELLKFAMEDPTLQSPILGSPAMGHGMIMINGWLLPGHGGCVAWYGMCSQLGDFASVSRPDDHPPHPISLDT